MTTPPLEFAIDTPDRKEYDNSYPVTSAIGIQKTFDLIIDT